MHNTLISTMQQLFCMRLPRHTISRKRAVSAILLDMPRRVCYTRTHGNRPYSTHSLITKYLAWCGKHRSPRTLEWYTGHLDNFLDHLGDAKDSPAAELKPYHVIEWIDAQTGWGDNYSRGAIVAVQRAYNWAEEMGYIAATPLRKIKKPPAKRRETYMTPEDFQAILGLLAEGDPFRDFFMFVWMTGCRPQEAQAHRAPPRRAGQRADRLPRRGEQGQAVKADHLPPGRGPGDHPAAHGRQGRGQAVSEQAGRRMDEVRGL